MQINSFSQLQHAYDSYLTMAYPPDFPADCSHARHAAYLVCQYQNKDYGMPKKFSIP